MRSPRRTPRAEPPPRGVLPPSSASDATLALHPLRGGGTHDIVSQLLSRVTDVRFEAPVRPRRASDRRGRRRAERAIPQHQPIVVARRPLARLREPTTWRRRPLRHRVRRNGRTAPHVERWRGYASLLVTGRADDPVRLEPRRDVEPVRHSAGRDGRASTHAPGREQRRDVRAPSLLVAGRATHRVRFRSRWR